MSWKSLVCAGLLCALAAPVSAAPSLSVTKTYNQGLGKILWEITASQDTTNSLELEGGFELSNVAPSFVTQVYGNSSTSDTTNDAGDANGAAGETWYYNETSAGSGTLVWNTQQLASDLTQSVGTNFFDSNSITEVLWIDQTAGQVFAALGSDVNLPVPVPTLHIATKDGTFAWNDVILIEGGAQTLVSGALSSVKRVDMNGDGLISGLDIQPFIDVANGLLTTAYEPVYPGLDGVARADADGSGSVTGLDIQPAIDCFNNASLCPGPIVGAGAGAAAGVSSAVPEPASAVLMLLGAIAFASLRKRQ